MATLPPAVNGTEQRLDALLVELRALRQEIAQRPAPPAPPAPPTPETITLREPIARTPPATAKPKRH